MSGGKQPINGRRFPRRSKSPAAPPGVKAYEDDGLERVETLSDGNCLFRAVSMGLNGTADRHPVLRQVAVHYQRKNRKDFEQFVTYNEVEGMGRRTRSSSQSPTQVPTVAAFDRRMELMSQDREWADHPELEALSRAYSVHIRLYQEDQEKFLDINDKARVGPLRLYLTHTPNDVANHYSFLKPAGSEDFILTAKNNDGTRSRSSSSKRSYSERDDDLAKDEGPRKRASKERDDYDLVVTENTAAEHATLIGKGASLGHATGRGLRIKPVVSIGGKKREEPREDVVKRRNDKWIVNTADTAADRDILTGKLESDLGHVTGNGLRYKPVVDYADDERVLPPKTKPHNGTRSTKTPTSRKKQPPRSRRASTPDSVASTSDHVPTSANTSPLPTRSHTSLAEGFQGEDDAAQKGRKLRPRKPLHEQVAESRKWAQEQKQRLMAGKQMSSASGIGQVGEVQA